MFKNTYTLYYNSKKLAPKVFRRLLKRFDMTLTL